MQGSSIAVTSVRRYWEKRRRS